MREATRERVKRYREAQKALHEEDVTRSDVTQNTGLRRDMDEAWEHVIDLISRPTNKPGDMPHLERHQRIAGSLGKYASEVWLGQGGLTAQDIGRVIGIQGPYVTR